LRYLLGILGHNNPIGRIYNQLNPIQNELNPGDTINILFFALYSISNKNHSKNYLIIKVMFCYCL